MTPRQKRIIVAIAIVDVLVILALVVLASRLFSTALSSPLAATPVPGTFSQGVCQWKATQLLAQAHLGGIVTLPPGGSLRFDIVYPLAPDQTVDKAAQQVWTAFDVALALEEEQCVIFSQVEVSILVTLPDARVRSNQGDVRIDASVSTVNLKTFTVGALSEDEFIERVFYETSSINEQ